MRANLHMDMLPTGKKENVRSMSSASAGVGELIKPLGSITAKGFEDTLNVNVRGPSLQYKRQCRSWRTAGQSFWIVLPESRDFRLYRLQCKQSSHSFFLPELGLAGSKERSGVNVIAPGTTDTAIFDGAPQEMKDSFVTIIPIGSMDQPREIASDALFLASDDFSFVTGIELYVDSGTAQV